MDSSLMTSDESMPANASCGLKTKHWVYKRMPILEWMPKYNVKRDLKFDIIAGITVAMMILPQAISMASLMNVPAIYALYTAAITPMVYPLFGTSRVLSVACAAEVSLLTGTFLDTIEDETERVYTGILVTFYTGMIMVLMGVLNLGLIVDFFSRPVMGGFVSAGGVLIALSQVKHWFGVKVQSSEFAAVTVYRIVKEIPHGNFPSFVLGCFSMVLLFFLRYAKRNLLEAPKLEDLFDNSSSKVAEETSTAVKKTKKSKSRKDLLSSENVLIETPTNGDSTTWSFSIAEDKYMTLEEEKNHSTEEMTEEERKKEKRRLLLCFVSRLVCDLSALINCVIGIFVGYMIYTYASFSITLTGDIPSGFPEPVLPWSEFGDIIPTSQFGAISINAFFIAIVSYMSSIAMAKRLAIKDGYEINPNQELLGIGFASIVGAFFQGMPPTGAMSRTAVNAQNAKTQLASIFTAMIVIFVIMFATEPMFYLPKASLASIIIVAASGLVELEEAKWLYRVKRDEFWVWIGAFSLTIILGVLPGLVCSIVCSLVAIMYRTKRPSLIAVGQMPSFNGTRTFASTDAFPEATPLADIEIIRVEGSLYFANCEHIQRKIEEMVADRQKKEKKNDDLPESEKLIGVILDAAAINDYDATALQVMKDLIAKLKTSNVTFAIGNIRKNVEKLFQMSGYEELLLQGERLHITIDEAVAIIRENHLGNTSAGDIQLDESLIQAA